MPSSCIDDDVTKLQSVREDFLVPFFIFYRSFFLGAVGTHERKRKRKEWLRKKKPFAECEKKSSCARSSCANRNDCRFAWLLFIYRKLAFYFSRLFGVCVCGCFPRLRQATRQLPDRLWSSSIKWLSNFSLSLTADLHNSLESWECEA